MLNTEIAIIRGTTYEVIRQGGKALVSSKSTPGAWHCAHIAGECDCDGYRHRQHCAHLDALQALEVQREVEQIESEIAERECRIRELREGLAELAASPAKALPAATPASKLHRLSAEAQASIL